MTIMVCFLLVIASIIAEAQQMQSNISRGSSLTPTSNSSWLSRSGIYAFGFYKQGTGYAVGIFLVGIPQNTVVWTAKRDDPRVSSNVTLLFTSDGLAFPSTEGQNFMIKSTVSASWASMLDSGNFVIYNARHDIVWQSFDHPTDTLLPGQSLIVGEELFSATSGIDHSTGIFRLKMQDDGNLVQYPLNTPDTSTYAYYASNTAGSGKNVTLNFDVDGHLYLLNDTGSNIKNITDGGLPTDQGTSYLVRIDADGIFRLYSNNLKMGSWSIKWESSKDKCDPKGLCGLNSYCVSIDLEAECRCLPGFESANQGSQTSGCSRIIVADVCQYKNGNFTCTMQELSSTIWENAPYLVLTLPDKQACKQACLEDYNCEAVFFVDTSCRKQRLPLRYGRRLMTTSNVALIKVGISTTTPNTGTIPKSRIKKKIRIDILIFSVSLGVFGSILLVISVILMWKRNAWAYKRMSNPYGDSELNEDVGPRPYAYAELDKMTSNFTEEVGRGASGTVYKGVIVKSQKPVAVKRLDKIAAESEKEFQTEMKVIGRTHHKNLVRLLGYCLHGPKKLLVYEYMSNGSLADVLFTPERQPLWEARMGIARNIARGFLYLHEECDTQIIHCDIKPQNILMDEYMCPKISDFGLAKLLKADQTRTSTGIRGTKGYVAPEWHRKMPITVKADVYSFGIVLLEIICCRRNVDWSLPEEEAILDELAYNCFERGQLGKLMGDEEIDIRQFERMIKVGLWCIQDEPSMRPSTKKVLLMLEGTVDIPIPPSPNSFLSAM